MSGLVPLRAILLAGLRGDAALMALVNSVEDMGVAKQTAPAIVLGQLAASEWGGRGIRGLTVRVPLTLIDRSDVPDRLDAAAARIDAVMDSLPEAAGDWRIGTVTFDRSRALRGGDGQWSMMIDYRVRLSRIV